MESVTLGDLYRAYRKAKADAHYERAHFHALAYADYEMQLEKNLRRLLRSIRNSHSWAHSPKLFGSYTYLPKSIDVPRKKDGREIHFATLDPIQDWIRSAALNGGRLEAKFRPVILASVDYQVISALWIMRVGHKFDQKINRELVYAHKLKRVGRSGLINENSHQFFEPYFYGYRKWRSNGIEAIRSALTLNSKRAIVAVTMDVQEFYHSVSAKFMLRKAFLKRLNIDIDDEGVEFTQALLVSIANWYAGTPEYAKRPDGALPVGLSASRLISNVLLAEFDEALACHSKNIHYGRYADDIFLVMEADKSVQSGEDFIRWLRKELDDYLVLDKESPEAGLRVKFSYAQDSKIVFSSKKQKIFFLSGEHGLDLVGQIEEQIRKQSSEYRLLPELPEGESEMLSLALLATPDARLEADALRKAEAVSLRRLGFSFLLGDFEAYARDLDHSDPAWAEARVKFYGIVNRYVVTPSGFFDYFAYIVRVFGLMVACRDFEYAGKLIDCLIKVCEVLRETTTAGTTARRAFQLARQSYFRGFQQAALESATVAKFDLAPGFMHLLRRISEETRSLLGDRRDVAELVNRLLLSDLGRRSYQEFWYSENILHDQQPPLPKSISVTRVLARVREFREKAKKNLNAPYWPAIAFPTRPPAPWQLSLSVPRALEEPGAFERLIQAVRGGYVNPKYRRYTFVGEDEQRRRVIQVPAHQDLKVSVALPSFKVTDEQWSAAIKDIPDHSLERYLSVRRIINRMMMSDSSLKYIVFPELSLPYWWALDIASRLARSGISFISGVENHGKGSEYKNEVLVSLVTNFYGGRSNICFLQPKIALSHDESKLVRKAKKGFSQVSGVNERRPIYIHEDFSFGVLICSDLTTIQNRSYFQGAIDALFVVEWNKDVDTFGFLVESAAHDLHAAVIQVNNRLYGDSRVRLPYAKNYRRDVVKVKGGDADFFVCCSFDADVLRRFQINPSSAKVVSGEDMFKPVPIGYRMSEHRRGEG